MVNQTCLSENPQTLNGFLHVATVIVVFFIAVVASGGDSGVGSGGSWKCDAGDLWHWWGISC